eukprot:899671-Lingulodinium_polyedra.AAC.1
MVPGDVRGHGSHEWMMTASPVASQSDWALELIGSMITYPFAVDIFVEVARSTKPDCSAKQL